MLHKVSHLLVDFSKQYNSTNHEIEES